MKSNFNKDRYFYLLEQEEILEKQGRSLYECFSQWNYYWRRFWTSGEKV